MDQSQRSQPGAVRMTLPDVLEALAVRLPGRVRADHLKAPDEPLMLSYLVRVGDDWKRVWERKLINWHGAYGPWWLEMACREECEARGWGISQKIWNDGSGITTVNVSVPGCPYLPSGKGDTPAEALCLALLSALEAQ